MRLVCMKQTNRTVRRKDEVNYCLKVHTFSLAIPTFPLGNIDEVKTCRILTLLQMYSDDDCLSRSCKNDSSLISVNT